MVAKRVDESLTVEEYLTRERVGEIKHEYVDGSLRAMAGATIGHGLVISNLQTLLRLHLRGTPCRVMASDLKVRTHERYFFYPDLVVFCDPREVQQLRQDTIRHPKLIIEVLSPSTALFDRNEKFEYYRQLASLEEYVLIETTRQGVDCFRRRVAQGTIWEYQAYREGDEVVLASIDFRCPIAALYEDISFDTAEEEQAAE